MPEPFAALLQQALGLVREHQYVALFFLIAIEEAGLPLPAPGDLIIAYYGWRAGGDPYEIAQVVLTCALASTTGTLVPYALSRRYGDQVARRVGAWPSPGRGERCGLPWHRDRAGRWGPGRRARRSG